MAIWLKFLILFLLFGFLGLSQGSFLPHFSIMGTTVNLIFIIFFLAVFFEEPQKYTQGLFSAVIAGFFLSVFSFSFFEKIIGCLIVIVFAIKYILFLLRKKRDKYPIVYFAPLFLLSYIFFNLLITPTCPNFVFLIGAVYNLVIAVFCFYLCKKFLIKLYGF